MGSLFFFQTQDKLNYCFEKKKKRSQISFINFRCAETETDVDKPVKGPFIHV